MNKIRFTSWIVWINSIWLTTFVWGMAFGWTAPGNIYAQSELDPKPPDKTVKLIFIHHSTGENWLTDGYGNLGKTLGENNYFVSDTNYGWGPNTIGDRTDIPNWLEWFASPDTPIYMDAVYKESGQNSAYTRTLSDTGGENEIIMFKSCFPNSQLEGKPDDPPISGGDALTVSNAKYVYSQILTYFKTRPDKLFIVITAPPVTDPTLAVNARAFDKWLMNSWLTENNYPYKNVAVWDFYNILTSKTNHHRFIDGKVEYVANETTNTSFYPSGDDHPSPEGSQKATAEFIPMLNVFYHQWRANLDAGDIIQQPETTVQTVNTPQSSQTNQSQINAGLIESFDGNPPPNTNGWEAWADETTKSTVILAVDPNIKLAGKSALRVDFNIPDDGWGSASLIYNNLQNWQAAQGISFAYHSNKPGLGVRLAALGGSADNLSSYGYYLETTQESVDGWSVIEVPWNKLPRVDWEEQAGSPIDPTKIRGVAFGLGGTGSIWIDEIKLMGGEGQHLESPPGDQPLNAQPTEKGPEMLPATETTVPETQQVQTPDNKGPLGGFCSCPGALLLAFMMGALWLRRVL